MCQANTKRDERLRVPRSELLIMHVRHTHRTHPRIRAPMRCARVDTGLCLVYDDDDCKTERTGALFYYFSIWTHANLECLLTRLDQAGLHPPRSNHRLLKGLVVLAGVPIFFYILTITTHTKRTTHIITPLRAAPSKGPQHACFQSTLASLVAW